MDVLIRTGDLAFRIFCITSVVLDGMLIEFIIIHIIWSDSEYRREEMSSSESSESRSESL
jgi:hypothetical protein